MFINMQIISSINAGVHIFTKDQFWPTFHFFLSVRICEQQKD